MVIKLALFLLFILFVFLFLGFPIFLTLIISSAATFLHFYSNLDPGIISQRLVMGIDKFSLMAIPFFIFAAEVMSEGEIGKKLVKLTKTLVGHLRGGFAIAVVLACLIFGAISGAGSAAVVAIGTLVYKPMIESKYGDKFSLGVVLSSSTLAMLIPPSIAYVLYATVTGASIGVLFMSGLQAGIFVGLVYTVYCYIYAKKYNIPLEPKATVKEAMVSIKSALWALGLPIVIIVGIYGGVTTPTEAAAIAAVYAIFVEMFVYKSINLKKLIDISVSSGKMIAMLMVLIAAGSVLSWVMTTAQVPQTLARLLGGSSKIVVLIIINAIFLVAGMLIDPNSAVIVLTPLIYPTAQVVGIDVVHLATIIVFNLAIGMLTPPFGLNIFIGSAVLKTSYEKTVSGVLPFILLSIVILILVTYIPALSLWLPKVLLGY